nr:uncharacterized protein LOC105318180 isoform X4 [Crassostrea gigas]
MLYHWRTASTNLKLGLVLLTIALVVFIAGLSSGFWVKRDTLQVDVYRDTYGLWVHNKCDEPRGCHEDPLNSVYLENRGWTGWFRLTQAVECLGLMFVLLYKVVSPYTSREMPGSDVLFYFTGWFRLTQAVECLGLTFCSILQGGFALHKPWNAWV